MEDRAKRRTRYNVHIKRTCDYVKINSLLLVIVLNGDLRVPAVLYPSRPYVLLLG